MTEETTVESTMPDIVDYWLVKWLKTTELDDTGGKGSLNWGIHADYIVVF